MTAPRVADDDGRVPTEVVEYCGCVRHLLGNLEGTFGRRGWVATLLVGGDSVALADLGSKPVQVSVGEPGSSVQEQHRRPGPGHPAPQLPTRHRYGDFLAFHGAGAYLACQ